MQARNDGQAAVKSAHLYQEEIESATPAPDPNTLRPEPIFQGNLKECSNERTGKK